MDIAGKVFIVTGGASGLGEGTARMLARNGGKVVIADLQADKGEAIARTRRRIRQARRQPGGRRPGPSPRRGLGKPDGPRSTAPASRPAAKTVGKDGAHALALFAKVITVNPVGSFNMIRPPPRRWRRTSPSPPASAAC